MAQVDYFLKIDGIEGESHDAKHKNEIHIDSFSWSEKQQGTHMAGGGGGAGKVAMGDFHFTMKVNKSSPKLMLACADGEHIKTAVLTCRKAAGHPPLEFYKITLSDILVSSFQTTGSGHGDLIPHDQITLNYSKIEFEYKEQDAKGHGLAAVKAGWDVKANKAV
jgi:type VI secretion system secreted protein Hcp